MPQYYHHKNEAVEREGICCLEKIQIPSRSFNTSTLVVSQCLSSFTCVPEILVSIALCMGFFLWLRISDLFKMLHLRLYLKLAMTESESVWTVSCLLQ